MFIEDFILVLLASLLLYSFYWLLKGDYSFFQLIMRIFYFSLTFFILIKLPVIFPEFLYEKECVSEIFIDNVHLKERKVCIKERIKQLHIGREIQYKYFKEIDYSISLDRQLKKEKEY